MTTRARVINDALIACDEPPATGQNDTARWVVRVANHYDGVAQKLLEKHSWGFATKRVQLQQLELSDAELIGRDLAYNKPGDCLRILVVNASGSAEEQGAPNYEDERGRILTDLDPCYLHYVSSDWLNLEGAWPQVFADAVALELAAKCYGLFGKSATKKDELKKDARIALQAAKSWDAAQKPFRRLPEGRWASARRGGRSPYDRGGTFE